MKLKLILIVFFLISISTFTKAQEKSKQPVRIALRAGLHFSRFKFDNLPSTYATPKGDDAFYVGMQVDVPISKKVSLVPEILYAISSVQSYNVRLFQDDFSQLLIPVLLKYKLGKVSMFAGPQAEVLITANAPYYVNSDVKDSYRKLCVSGVVCAEWAFKYRFGIDARYQFGITDFNEPDGSTVLTSHGSIKASAFQAGLFFRFGKKPGMDK